MEAVGGITQRWRMGAEARALMILSGVLLAFGLATRLQRERDRRDAGALRARAFPGAAARRHGVGALLFAIAAKFDAELWEAGRGRS